MITMKCHLCRVLAQMIIVNSAELKCPDGLVPDFPRSSFGKMDGRAQAEARETAQMYNSLLERERMLFTEVSNYVFDKEFSDLRKKEVLHKKWTQRVHEPIRRRLLSGTNSRSTSANFDRKRDLHIEYLEFLNKKGHAFLDTYPPDEYYPLGLHSSKSATMTRSKSAPTIDDQDPLLSQQRDRSEEDRTILRCQTGHIYSNKDIDDVKLPPLPLVPLGRHGTECSTWLAMPYHYIESPIRIQSRAKMRKDNNSSQFGFRDWGKSVDQRTVDGELQIERLGTNGVQHVAMPVPDMIKNHMLIPSK